MLLCRKFSGNYTIDPYKEHTTDVDAAVRSSCLVQYSCFIALTGVVAAAHRQKRNTSSARAYGKRPASR